jgi:predicted transcriptional regulator
MAPKTATKDEDNQGIVFAETQEWIKIATCFGCGKKRQLLEDCKMTPKKERQKVWGTMHKEFDNAASAVASTRMKTKKTMGVINQTMKEVTSSEEDEDKDKR